MNIFVGRQKPYRDFLEKAERSQVTREKVKYIAGASFFHMKGFPFYQFFCF
jgi:hypothetical protein